MTDREMLLQMWDELWKQYTWIPGWSQSFEGLTPQHAAWKPAAGRNSIWQHVHHVAFWRETMIRRLANDPPSDGEIQKGNFEAPSKVSEDAWLAAQERLQRSHDAIRTALADEKTPVDKIRQLVPHDAYHLGQIMLLRAMQGLPPLAY